MTNENYEKMCHEGMMRKWKAPTLNATAGYAWIDVNDSIPQPNQVVLVVTNGEVHEAECWLGNNGRAKNPEWNAPYYGQDLSYDFENVTHWMPMPSLPQNTEVRDASPHATNNSEG